MLRLCSISEILWNTGVLFSDTAIMQNVFRPQEIRKLNKERKTRNISGKETNVFLLEVNK